MGYYVSLHDSDFVIPEDKEEDALKAIHDLYGKNQSYSWVVDSACLEAETLEEALMAWRWGYRSGELYFEGEKLGDDIILFCAIAPFVNAGSFIEMHGEEGFMWRWVFDGKECHEIEPTVTW